MKLEQIKKIYTEQVAQYSILRVWFESGTDGTWHYKPTLCIQVAGKLSEARIPMPCAR